MKSSIINSQQFDLLWHCTLSDYVTAIAWSPDGKTLAASDAAGEVNLWQPSGEISTLQAASSVSLDCIAFSQDGQFLAAGGQDGQVKIWRDGDLIATLENAPAWVDKLAWSPTSNQLAFSLGRYVQIWDADTENVSATLNFEASSVLGLDWRCNGEELAIAGYQGVKIWNSKDWNDDPVILDMPSASVAIAWSPDGEYFAAGNMDRTIAVWKWNSPHPWIMRGFPGKIRSLAWSTAKTELSAPLLASSSLDGIVVWEKLADDDLGWESRVLTRHTDVVQGIAFQPDSFLLASASANGQVCLWNKARRIAQVLNSAADGFSCLAWHPQIKGRTQEGLPLLAAGGHNGELLVWTKSKRGQGFNRRD